MSVPKQQEAVEANEETRDGFGGSPLYSDRDLYFRFPPSPQYWDLCLSPLWNSEEDYASQSHFTGTTYGLSVVDLPRSLSCDLESYESPADNYDKRGPYTLLCTKRKIFQALKYLKESIKQHFLAQVWMPVKRGNGYFLTTSGAPFVLNCHYAGLLQYRMVSLTYSFPADDENACLGLPGRVFRSKLPEWTPNVQYFSSKEYPLVNCALCYNIRGTLGLPLFEPGGSCIGVLELLMTSMLINYAPVMDLLCTALRAAELRSSEICDLPCTRVLKDNQSILMEVMWVLSVVSESCRLPLAQTWIPCSSHCQVLMDHGRLHPCSSYNGNSRKDVCLSTCAVAFYVVDPHMWGFREACIEQHLSEGQGVVGRAFSSLHLCFCRDIVQLSKADYPLAHYARMFGLQSCLAVPVHNSETASDIYVLELFLPPNLTDCESLHKLLAPLCETIRQCSQNLQIVSHKEFRQERDIEIISFPLEEKFVLGPEYFQRFQNIRPPKYGHEYDQTVKSLSSAYMPEASQTGKERVKTISHEQQKKLEGAVIHSVRKKDEDQGNVSVTVPAKEDKWTLEVLQQLYGMSLANAAECLGVSRSTIKRICRKLGISRWPSYKRKKTNSFSLLNKSVQGDDRSISRAWKFSPLNCSLQNASTPAFRHGFPHCTQAELMGRFLTKKSSTAEKDLQPWGLEKQVLDSSRPLPSSNLGLHLEKAVAAIAPKTPTVAAAPSERTLSINARYQQKTTQFLLHFPLTMTNLEKELAEMLKLKLGTFTIKYLDTENDWILMASDDDLQDLTVVSGSPCDGNNSNDCSGNP